MDAKPQRQYAGGLQAPGNENVAPLRTGIHQRHKSAGNLKGTSNNVPSTNQHAAAGLKGAPKRPGLYEVNTNIAATSQDLAKKAVSGAGKENIIRKTTLQKLGPRNNKSYSSLKENRNTVTYIPDNVTHTKAPPAAETNKRLLLKGSSDSLPPSQALMKPPVTKKATFVYQDSHQHHEEERDVEPSYTSSDEPAIQVQPKPAIRPRHYKSQPVLKAEQPNLRRAFSRHFSEVDHLVVEVEAAEEAEESAYEDALEGVSTRGAPVDMSVERVQSTAEPGQVQSELDHQIENTVAKRSSNAPPTSFESEDGWEEEEEDGDMEEDQGYTTSHSYRSHGENTTGGLTLLLAPKANARVQQELREAKFFVEECRTLEEIDEELWDVSMVAEYGEEIFDYMRDLEVRMTPCPHYMDIQTELQWSMRSVLIDWIVQVHHRFTLLPETLFLTVNYIDRFLSQKVVSVGKLQLVGATALFIAAKYEEINCPSVTEIQFMVDNSFSTDEILKAERFMLSMLQYELGWPGPMSFLRRISKADDYDLETRTLSKYFLEVTIMDERFVGCPPSYLAAGAHCLSRLILKKGDWAHTHWSGYTWSQLRPLVTLLFECCQRPEKHHNAVWEKYSDSRYKSASTYVQNQILRGFRVGSQGQYPIVLDSSHYSEESVSAARHSSLEADMMRIIAASQT